MNNSTWYNGVDIYPQLLPNPSISSEYPSNYVGEEGDTFPIPGFVYSIGGTTPLHSSCVQGAQDFIIHPQDFSQVSTPDLSINSSPTIEWAPSLPSDRVQFTSTEGNTSMMFSINLSNYNPGAHWAIGSLGSPQNYTAYNAGVIRYSLSNLDPKYLQFGFHSGRNGSGFVLNHFSSIGDGPSEVVILPLNDPSVLGGGSLLNVSNIFFVYDPPQSEPGVGLLTVDSIRLAAGPPYQVSDWEPSFSTDSFVQSGFTPDSHETFQVNDSVYESNGHWLVGNFQKPQNLSRYDYAIVNYTLTNVAPRYLQFGYHSGASGNGYLLSDFLTLVRNQSNTTIIPLDNPSILGGGSLSDATNLFFVYDPPSTVKGDATIRLNDVVMCTGSPDGNQLLAEDLDRLGVTYAYVDTSIQPAGVPAFQGQYYNLVFGSSRYFEKVFSQGTVTIYRDLLARGVFTTADAILEESSTSGLVDGAWFNYTTPYYNLSDANATVVSGVLPSIPGGLVRASITSSEELSSTEYSLKLQSTGWSLLLFRNSFSPAWVALVNGTNPISTHLEVDGFANGWLVPPWARDILITYRGQSAYGFEEALSFSSPAVRVLALACWIYWPRLRNRLGKLYWLGKSAISKGGANQVKKPVESRSAQSGIHPRT